MTKLELLLKYVYEHNNFYKNRVKEYGIKNPLDINQWPVLDPTHVYLINQGKDCYEQKMKVICSSGSSGQAKKIIWAQSDYIKMCLNAWRLRNRWYHISPSMKTLSFYGVTYYNDFIDLINSNKEYYFSNGSLLINYSFLYSNPKATQRVINNFSPELIIALPSILSFLINKNIVNEFVDGVKYIELIGEKSLPSQREYFANVFKKAKIVNMYGTSETGVVALECPCGKMHVISDNCYVENSYNDNILLTSLTNTLSPFIRYDIGDQGIVENGLCDCGYNSQVITELSGREAEEIILSDGSSISSSFIMDCIVSVNIEFNCSILYYSALQKEPGAIEISITLSDEYLNWASTILSKVRNRRNRIIRIVNSNLNVIFSVKTHDMGIKQNLFKSLINKK